MTGEASQLEWPQSDLGVYRVTMVFTEWPWCSQNDRGVHRVTMVFTE